MVDKLSIKDLAGAGYGNKLILLAADNTVTKTGNEKVDAVNKVQDKQNNAQSQKPLKLVIVLHDRNQDSPNSQKIMLLPIDKLKVSNLDKIIDLYDNPETIAVFITKFRQENSSPVWYGKFNADTLQKEDFFKDLDAFIVISYTSQNEQIETIDASIVFRSAPGIQLGNISKRVSFNSSSDKASANAAETAETKVIDWALDDLIQGMISTFIVHLSQKILDYQNQLKEITSAYDQKIAEEKKNLKKDSSPAFALVIEADVQKLEDEKKQKVEELEQFIDDLTKKRNQLTDRSNKFLVKSEREKLLKNQNRVLSIDFSNMLTVGYNPPTTENPLKYSIGPNIAFSTMLGFTPYLPSKDSKLNYLQYNDTIKNTAVIGAAFSWYPTVPDYKNPANNHLLYETWTIQNFNVSGILGYRFDLYPMELSAQLMPGANITYYNGKNEFGKILETTTTHFTLGGSVGLNFFLPLQNDRLKILLGVNYDIKGEFRSDGEQNRVEQSVVLNLIFRNIFDIYTNKAR